MNVLLTDHMACPRCGPPFGVLLVAREVEDRRVRRGEFGCANCRDSFPVEDGFADMRPQPRSPAPSREERMLDGDGADTPASLARARPGARENGLARGSDAALRLAAGLGVTEGPGIVIVWDGRERDVVGLAKLVPGVEFVATGWAAREFALDGVSAMAVGPALPFRDGTALGVVIAGADDPDRWRESVRVARPGARILAIKPSADTPGRMSGAGCVLLAQDEDLVVATPER